MTAELSPLTSCQPTKLDLWVWGVDRDRLGGAIQPSGWGHGKAELPLAALVYKRGQSLFWTKAEVEAGLCSLASEQLGSDRTDPQGKGSKTGAQAQLAPCNTHICKTSCFQFLFSLQESISSNSLELIYIKTIKYGSEI